MLTGTRNSQRQRCRPCRVLMVLTAIALTGAGSAACTSGGQMQSDNEHTSISLGSNDLESYGIGFLTPAAATGRETDKQSLALVYSNELEEIRTGVKVVPLPAILSVVNANGYSDEYRDMYRDYLETGILDRELLRIIGEVAEVRFLAQLSLVGFRRGARNRFSFLGFRMFVTENANMRVFMQIWDSHTGTVAWEGTQELNFAYETGREKPVTFQEIGELSARGLFATLPQPVEQPPSADGTVSAAPGDEQTAADAVN